MEDVEALVAAAGPLGVVGIVFVAVALLVGLGYYLGTVRPLRRRRRILATGEPAEATVIDVRDSGGRELSGIVLAIDLDVRRAGHPPYRATTHYHWRRSRALYQSPPAPPPGSTVQVRVDRANPRRVEIADPVGAGTPAIPLNLHADPDSKARLFSSQVFIIGDKQYASPAEMPPEVRADFERVRQALGDEDGNGMPDLFDTLAGQGAADRPPGADSSLARLRELTSMRDQGLITEAEYAAKKAEILRRM